MKEENVKVIKGHAGRGHNKGGWSQKRFNRLQAQARHEYLKKLADQVSEYFDQVPDLEGIIVGGPGSIKNDFIDKYLDKKYAEKVIYIADTGYSGKTGVRELINKASKDKVLEQQEYMKEKKMVDEFLSMLGTDDSLVEYGVKETIDRLEHGMVEKILVSEVLDDETILKLKDLAIKNGTSIELVSVETESGAMFSTFKVGALLRWKKTI
jgi:peptide chain release factor subunit 1